MWNSYFGSAFKLGNGFGNLGLKMAQKLPHGHSFQSSKTKLGRILTNYLKIGPIKSNQSNLHGFELKNPSSLLPWSFFSFRPVFVNWGKYSKGVRLFWSLKYNGNCKIFLLFNHRDHSNIYSDRHFCFDKARFIKSASARSATDF